ncbi:unnamed protein product [Prorocentrum cordatum]|uniref:Apple domain-containing protein n=1 Tax=Prorocentrum cordatum TaxID=2364126 RepID=A0ABN9RRU3_9DINO|nr:unnamed protein product [Polarella glacialis]
MALERPPGGADGPEQQRALLGEAPDASVEDAAEARQAAAGALGAFRWPRSLAETEATRAGPRLPGAAGPGRAPAVVLAGVVLVLTLVAALGAGAASLRQPRGARGGLGAPPAALSERKALHWARLGDDTACRAGGNGSRAGRAKPRRAASFSAQECQGVCEAESGCRGVQYGPGDACQLWGRPVTYFDREPGGSCAVRLPLGGPRRRENAACVVSPGGQPDDGADVVLKVVSGVEEELCQTLCRSAFGEGCMAVAYAAEPKRCEMWRQPVDFEERQGISCSTFESANDTAGGDARSAAQPEESSLPWGSLGWGSLLDWMATTTSTTTTTTTSTTTTTATTTTATTRTGPSRPPVPPAPRPPRPPRPLPCGSVPHRGPQRGLGRERPLGPEGGHPQAPIVVRGAQRVLQLRGGAGVPSHDPP